MYLCELENSLQFQMLQRFTDWNTYSTAQCVHFIAKQLKHKNQKRYKSLGEDWLAHYVPHVYISFNKSKD